MLVKKGDKVVKLLNIFGLETASIAIIAAVDKKRGLCSTDVEHISNPEDIEEDGAQTYVLEDGRALVNYIPGCSSRLVILEN